MKHIFTSQFACFLSEMAEELARTIKRENIDIAQSHLELLPFGCLTLYSLCLSQWYPGGETGFVSGADCGCEAGQGRAAGGRKCCS